MTGLVPLMLMWMYAQNRGPQPPAAPSVPSAPPWPTPSSPPPLPAFKAKPTPTPAPSADPSRSSTPLADLHKAPPKLAPASVIEPQALKARAQKKALDMFKGQLQTIDPWASDTASVPVAKIQDVVNSRGGKLKRDGLYGPKTAAAWSKLATSKGYPGAISRVNANTAKVVSRSYHALAVPPIP